MKTITQLDCGLSALSERVDVLSSRTALGLLLNSNVVYVSKSEAATDVRSGLSNYDPWKPFATLAAAYSAAVDGVDTVYVMPGNYYEPGIQLKNVDIFLCPGAVLGWDPSVYLETEDVFFSDEGSPVQCIIYGGGSVSVPEDGDYEPVFLKVTETETNVTVNILAFLGSYCTMVDQYAGRVYLSASEVNGNFSNTDGEQNITANQSNGGNYTQAGASGQQRIYVNYFIAGAGYFCSNGLQFIHSEATYAKATCSGGVQSINSIEVNYLSLTSALECSGGVQKVNASVIHSGSGEANVLVTGGECLITASKITEVSTGGGSQTDDTILITGGTLTLRLAKVIGTAGKNPIRKTGGTLILQNPILVAASGRESIISPTAQNVICYGAVANAAKNENVTLQVNPSGFIVDALVQ